MLDWQKASQQLQRLADVVIQFVKARKREEASIGLSALLFWVAYSFPKWLTPEVKEWVGAWKGLLIIPGVFYITGAAFFFYGLYRLWQLVHAPDLPPSKNRPSAIKGPIAFAPADGELFRKLGREDELGKLLGFVEDDQVQLVVLMGASGAGKTSLLRAGLTDALKDKDIDYHYWEAVPTSPGFRLLRAIQESWQLGPVLDAHGARNPLSVAKPESLEDLVNPSHDFGVRRHVIVIDQFEQLHGSSTNSPVFRLMRKVAREAKPPHRITWILAFRREFRAEWEDFTIPEKERGIFPAEISLRLFSREQARHVISQLIKEAHFSIQQRVVDDLLEAATVDGEVSPVEIGIGLMALAELQDRHGGQTVSLDDYHFAGGAEGLLTQYINRYLDNFPEEDRKAILNALLALRDPETNQRLAEGKTHAQLAEEIKANGPRLKTQLERLTKRDIRLLEHFAFTEGEDIRYRLPHERLIPALNRMAGSVLGELEEAKGKLVNGFSAWKKNNASQYLLKGRDLRLVERYKRQIPWGKDEREKLQFLKRGQRQRSLRRLISGMLIASLIVGIWLASLQYQRYDNRRYLRDNDYPPELYDYQQQLKRLELTEIFNLKRLRWLRSNTLEEFTVRVTNSTDRDDREFGLNEALTLDELVDSLVRCPALKHLTLKISGEMPNLEPLAKLPNLKQLTLDIGYVQGRWNGIDDFEGANLKSLAKLTKLTQLTLTFAQDELPNFEPLAELPNLAQLTLKYKGGHVSRLESLAKLPKHIRLNLEIGDRFNRDLTDLEPFTKLPNLTQFRLVLSGSKVTNVEPLSRLPKGTALILDVSDSQVKNWDELANLPNLTELKLDISDDKKTNLAPLAKLINLTRLTFYLNGVQVPNLESLAELPKLTQLYLALHYDQVTDLESLPKLSGLSQLTLKLSGSDVAKLESLAKLPNHTHLILDISGTDVTNLEPLVKLRNLTQLYLDISDSDVTNLEPLVQLPNLTQLNLYVRDNQVLDLEQLAKLSNSTQLHLDISGNQVKNSGNQVKNFEPISRLNCQTLKLHLTASQRMSLKAIPKSVTELTF